MSWTWVILLNLGELEMTLPFKQIPFRKFNLIINNNVKTMH